MLARDRLKSPLVEASPPYRIGGAFRVFARGLWQVVYPRTLSGDYSAPQEPIPDRLVFTESVLGAAAMLLPLVACPVLGLLAHRRWKRSRRPAAAPAPFPAAVRVHPLHLT